MRGGLKVQHLTAAVLDHEETIQNSERQRRHGEEVEGRRDLAMVQEREPALRFAGVTAALQSLQVARDGRARRWQTRVGAVRREYGARPRLSAFIRRINWRISVLIDGRPGVHRCDRHRQNR